METEEEPASFLERTRRDLINMMDLTTMYFIVESIDGDYAHLKRTDEDGEKLVARALLPPEIMEGTKLKYEMLQYEVIDG